VADDVLYMFWLVVTALFVFSTVYYWLIAVIVRKSLPGELAWVSAGLAFITTGNAFIRSNQGWIDPLHVVIIQRAMWMMTGISLCVAAVMLGISYNGNFKHKLDFRQQWGLLSRGCTDEEESNEVAQRAGSNSR
jgi:hypothetical protein